MKKNEYGMELIMDIHNCDITTFTRNSIRKYIKELCDGIIFMERADLHWWDYHGDSESYNNAPSHLKGISVVQFIMTSTIVIHSLEDLRKIFINIFSCKKFNTDIAREFSVRYFKGSIEHWEVVKRK